MQGHEEMITEMVKFLSKGHQEEETSEKIMVSVGNIGSFTIVSRSRQMQSAIGIAILLVL